MNKTTKIAWVSLVTGVIAGVYHQNFFYGSFVCMSIYTLFLVWASLEKYVDGDKNEPQA